MRVQVELPDFCPQPRTCVSFVEMKDAISAGLEFITIILAEDGCKYGGFNLDSGRYGMLGREDLRSTRERYLVESLLL